MSSDRLLPRGWHQLLNRSTGEIYYYNRYTRVVQRNVPDHQRANGRTSHGRERTRSRSPQTRVACSHILIKHKNSRSPIDSNNKPVTRSKEDARKIAEDVLDQICRDRITFADAAVSFSECASARNEGDLNSVIQRRRVQRTLEDAARILDAGQVSGIMETTSGFHIIMRREDED